jgi:hypothetical protein
MTQPRDGGPHMVYEKGFLNPEEMCNDSKSHHSIIGVWHPVAVAVTVTVTVPGARLLRSATSHSAHCPIS